MDDSVIIATMIGSAVAVSAALAYFTPLAQVCESYATKMGYRKNLVNLCKRSNEEINIATDLDPRVYSKRKVMTALRNSIERGVKIRILYDTAAEIPEQYAELQNKGLEIKHTKKLPEYFSVGDGKGILTRLKGHRPEFYIHNNRVVANKANEIFSNLYSSF